MSVILERLWREPAYFTSVFATVGVVLLQVVSLPDFIEIPISAVLVLMGGHITRQLVRPVRR